MPQTWSLLVAGLSVGLAVAAPLGPIGLLVVDRGSRVLREGLAAAGGVAAADLTWAVLAAVTGARLAAHPALGVGRSVARVALLAVGCYLAGRGIHELLHSVRERPGVIAVMAPRRPVRWMATTYALTLPNPLTVAVFTAVAVERQLSAAAREVAVFALAVGLASLTWHVGLAIGGGALLRRVGRRAPAALTVLVGIALALWSATS